MPSAGEELAVVGIFHELIGAGVLKGYRTLSSSSDSKYDAIIQYKVPLDSLGEKTQRSFKESSRKIKEKLEYYTQTGFVEFKVDAIDFMRDCDKGKKDPKEVMLLIAYDLSKRKIQNNWEVITIPDDEIIFWGTKIMIINKILGIAVPVILLKDYRKVENIGTDDLSD